ncbi:phage tail tape measure protein [Clostridium botulinum]|nr:phage tail tape measure protein [Clostridium botulinum]
MASSIKTTINIGGILEPSVQSSFAKINSLASGTMDKFTKLAKVTAGAVTAMSVVGVKSFANFEQSAANVNSTLGKNSTPEIMESYKKKAMELSDVMSKNSKEIMDGFNYLALAGWNSSDSLEHVNEIVQSSIVGQMDLAVCSDKITDSLSALGLKAQDTTKYTNTLALAQTKGNATMENLLDSYLTVGGTMKNYNIPLNESTAILDKLADQGLKGSEAGNSLSAIFVNLMGKTGQAKEAMDKLNISLFDSGGNVRNMSEFLFDLKGKLSGMTEEQRNTYISMIAGKNQLDAFNKLMNATDENLIALTEDLKDTDGSLDEAAKTIDKTLIGNFKKLINIISNTAIEIIDKFAPNINAALENMQTKLKELRPKIEEFAEKFIDNFAKVFSFIIDNAPKAFEIISNFIPIILGIGAAVSTLSIASKIATITEKVGKLSGVVSNIVFAFSSVSGGAATLGEAMAFIMGPIGWIALAIGAIIAIGTLLYMKCESFRNFINSSISSIISWFQSSLLPAIQSLVNSVLNFWNSVLWPFIQWISSVLAPLFIAAFSSIKNIVVNAFQFIGNIITNSFAIFQGVIDFITGVFSGNWSLAWQGIVETFSGIFNGIKNVAKAPINAVIGLINGAIAGINSISIDIPDWVPSWAGGGKHFGASIPEIPLLAKGGITNGVSIAGEEGSEAVIPLKRNNPRSLTLLEKTAGAIGANKEKRTGNTFVYSPQITGKVDNDTVALLKQNFEDFKEWVIQTFEEEERVAYE